MRLLHFDNSGRLILTDFSGRTIPPYAILSHRWGDDEVLFQDVVTNTYESKAGGYRKIKFCAKKTAQSQLQYFWIDTCCIDKWNLRELSKAINSMFRWYQNATKCYVFLSDVSASTATDARQQSTWDASFRASKWFTRGWTLQELIAPASVEFFSSEGQRLGDKKSLERLIHDITGIPVKALQSHPLDKFTVSERMEWAKNRETTEKEDIAYCLLGILDILMPLAYGEGKEKALARLLKEVETTNATPFIVPFNRNDRFIGQESQLAELEERIFIGGQTTRIAIAGPGGTGKSQLALELAYRTKLKYKNCAVFWIPASDIESLHQAYALIAEKLNVPGWDNEKEDVKKLVQVYLSRKSAGQWLIIYDNADDATLGSAGLSTLQAASLIDYLPVSELGTVIFTTTNSDTARALASQNIFEMQEMTPDIAQKMLEKYLSNPASTNEQQETKLLLQELSYLPLAIVQAAAYISVNEKSIKDYLSLLAKQKVVTKPSSEERLPCYRPNNPIATTWLLSLEKIRHDNPLAADCLFFIACMDQKDIPLDLLPTASSGETKDVVETLVAYALITKRPAESALDIHRLVHLEIHMWLQRQKQLDQWTQRAITRIQQAFPDNNHGNRSKWRRLLPHAKYALSYGLTEKEDEARTNLAWKCATTLYSDGRYNESGELFVQVMETRKRVLGPEHPDTLTSMANLALTYRNKGRWDEAKELLVQVMETRKRVLGPEHPDTLTSMANLASTFRNKGRWDEAEELDVQVIETSKRVLGPEHPDTLTSMANLALTYRNKGRWDEAKELLVQVMETRKRVLGPEHPDTLTSMANLASTFRNKGRWDEAEELFMQLMETHKRVLGPEHPFTLTSIANLASTYRNKGRWDDAEKLQAEELKICKRVLGPEHPDTLTSMANLASTYLYQGRQDEAEELFVQVIETNKRVLGPEHPDTLTSIANLATTYRNKGRWDEAEELFVQVIETRKTKLGADHPDTLASMANLASTYSYQGRQDEAEKLKVQVMETNKKKLGADHPDTLTSMANLASTYWNQGRWDAAEELEVQVIETSKKKLGADHPDTLNSMANLSYTWKAMGRQTEALKLMDKCVQIRKRVLGANHPHFLSSSATLSAWRLEGEG